MSTDRDKDLDELQAELRKPVPHIDGPDEVTPAQGAMCFLDRSRVCGADCASYLGENPLPAERCVVLSSVSLLTQELVQLRRGRDPHGPPSVPLIDPPSPYISQGRYKK